MDKNIYLHLLQSIHNNHIILERKGYDVIFSQSTGILSAMVFSPQFNLIAQLKVTDKNNEIAIRSYANRLNQLVKRIKQEVA